MSCEIKTYDICSRLGNTVFAKEFNIDVATAAWKLEMKIYGKYDVLLQTFDEVSGMTRISPTKWQVNQRLESLQLAERYVLTYKIAADNVVRDILQGKFTVKTK